MGHYVGLLPRKTILKKLRKDKNTTEKKKSRLRPAAMDTIREKTQEKEGAGNSRGETQKKKT